MSTIEDYRRKLIYTNTRSDFISRKNDFFLDTFKSAPEYEEIKINVDSNDTLYDTWIYSNSSYKEIISEKTVIFSPTTPVSIVRVGEYIRPQRQGGIFILISDDTQYEDKLKAIVKYCNFNLEYTNDVGNQLSLPCVMESQNSDVSENKYMILGNNVRRITIQTNNETLKLSRDQEFEIDDIIYRIVGINRLENEGITYFDLDEYQESNAVTHTYTINIQEEDLSFVIGESKQLNIIAKEDNDLISRPITYSSSDESVATVSDVGIVEGISDGNCIITASFRDNSSISDTVNIEITSSANDNIEYRFRDTDSNRLEVFSTNAYQFNKFNNDVIDPTSFTFSIDYNSNPQTIATLNVVDGNNCEIVANVNQVYGTIFLVVNDGIDERERFEIEIVSLWG